MGRMQYDIWAVTPATDDDYYRANASIAAAGVLSLLANTVGPYGYGYKIGITSAGDDTGITFTITGLRVGDLSGAVTTEVVTGVDTDTAVSANFYARVDYIVASGASAGNVKIGTVGNLALPRCRIKGMSYVASATPGTIKVNRNSLASDLLLQINTPGNEDVVNSLYMPAEGILTTRSGVNDYSEVTLADVSFVTLLCG
jgi:hypothetical protein